MHKFLYILFFCITTNCFSKVENNCYTKSLAEGKLEQRVVDLEKENAVLKERVGTFILENDKKLNMLSWPLGIIVVLLGTIYGIGAFRSVVLAKEEARKAFKEDFQEIKKKIDNLRIEAEKELQTIVTVKEIALEEAKKNNGQ